MLDEVSDKGKVGVAGSRICDFYLLKTALYQQSEEC